MLHGWQSQGKPAWEDSPLFSNLEHSELHEPTLTCSELLHDIFRLADRVVVVVESDGE